jgi:hypothetical protein
MSGRSAHPDFVSDVETGGDETTFPNPWSMPPITTFSSSPVSTSPFPTPPSGSPCCSYSSSCRRTRFGENANNGVRSLIQRLIYVFLRGHAYATLDGGHPKDARRSGPPGGPQRMQGR